jgi:8-oxo-dGTP pyrophosphatase MutT (NUDIX family)
MSNAPASPAPRHAATVLLLREAASDVEVLMIRRHQSLEFMGGMWVFPGGSLSSADSTPRALHRIADSARTGARGLQALNGSLLAAEESLGLYVAACRETFEEAGLLLAQHADGTPCSTLLIERLQAERAAVADDPTLFLTLLERENLYLDVGRLVYWSHWITPSNVGRRFDTRFFVIGMPREQALTSLSGESTEYTWMTPRALREAAQRDEMPIPAPTLSNLEDVEDAHRRHGSIAALLERERTRDVPPVLPKVIARDGNRPNILMPWDPDYASAAGESATTNIPYSEFLLRRPSRRSR